MFQEYLERTVLTDALQCRHLDFKLKLKVLSRDIERPHI